MRILRLTDRQAIDDAEGRLKMIFPYLSPFDCSTTNTESIRVALAYPVDFQLDPQLWEGVVQAASLLGEREAFISTIEGHDWKDFHEHQWHWRLDLLAWPYDELRHHGWPSIYENALYSCRGMWALKMAHTEHAVVAGPMEFVEHLARSDRRFSGESIAALEHSWATSPGGDVTWLKPCLDRMKRNP